LISQPERVHSEWGWARRIYNNDGSEITFEFLPLNLSLFFKLM